MSDRIPSDAIPMLSRCQTPGGNRQKVVIAASCGRAHNRDVSTDRTVVFVVFDDLQLLDLVGPLEVLRTATRLAASPRYRTLIASPRGRRVRSESGVDLGADVSLAELA